MGDDVALDAKRVYAGSRERAEVYVATDVGLARVEVAGNQVGRFALARRGTVRDVAGDGGRAHAVADGRLYERRAAAGAGERDDEGWTACDVPVEEPVVDVAYGESVYAVTGAGTVIVDADPEQTPDGHGGWRSRALEIDGTRAIVVP